MQVSVRDSLAIAGDSTSPADARVRATEYETVPPRAADDGALPPATTLAPAAALLVAGVLLGFAVGTRWRRRRREP